MVYFYLRNIKKEIDINWTLSILQEELKLENHKNLNQIFCLL